MNFPKRFSLLFGGILLFVSCNASFSHKPSTNPDVDKEKQILKATDNLINQRHYGRAYRTLNLLLTKRPYSPYADDMEYRLAYLHVIADSLNPYFDYALALQAFSHFVKKYPRSQYKSACNNWLKILYLLFDFKQRCETKQKSINVLQGKLQHLQQKNTELQNTLKDLERVIKRNE
ncbi:hypothetical protein DRI50_08350 [candidate division KSB1 bacterium]|nr:MAG: hypothetical protein DRI50_08350 [candidate division KSB1 bacterium]